MRRLALLAAIAACGSPASEPIDAPPVDADVIDAAPVDAVESMTDAQVVVDAPLDAAPDPFSALAALPARCSPDEWCWFAPTPHGNSYLRVVGTDRSNIWLIGTANTIMQWDGVRWRHHVPPSQPGQEYLKKPYNIVTKAADDTWLVYGSTVQHWDGAAWTTFLAGPLNQVPYYLGIWVAPAGDVYLTSPSAILRSQNNGPFEAVLGGHTGYSAIWGTADNDFFVTIPGSILHYDGTSLAPVYNNISQTFGGYLGAQNDVWVSGGNGTLMHWDGKVWTPVPSGLEPGALLMPLAYIATNDVWWLTGNDSLNQAFMHWDGATLTKLPIDRESFGEFCCPSINSGAIIDGTWWLVGGNGSVYTKTAPSAIRPVVSPRYYGGSFWGTGDSDMYIASGGGIVHWDGTTMETIGVEAGNVTGVPNAGVGGHHIIYGLGNDVDYTTNERAFYGYIFDGAEWTRTEIMRSSDVVGETIFLGGPYAISATEAMVIGERGYAFLYQDGTWARIDTGTTVNLRGVWGPDADTLYIIGRGGTFLRWDRANPLVFTPDPGGPPSTADFEVVHGTTIDGKLWIAHGSDPIQRVWRGTPGGGWDSFTLGFATRSIFAVTPNNVFFTGGQVDRFVRFNGTEMVAEDIGADQGFSRVFQPPGGRMWLGGTSGILLHP